MEDERGEVEDAADAGREELVGDLLGDGGGDGENGHADAVFPDEIGQPLAGQDGDRGARAEATRVGIEGGDDLEAFLGKAVVGEEGGAEVAGADEDDGLERLIAEHVGDHATQRLDVVAEAAGAELSEVGEVLAELGGFDAGGAGQGLAGDGLDGVVPQALEAAEVDGQPIDGFPGDLISRRSGGLHGAASRESTRASTSWSRASRPEGAPGDGS